MYKRRSVILKSENSHKYYTEKVRAIITPSIHDDHCEEFHGTYAELLAIVEKYSLIYGSCQYELILEPRILLEVE